MINIKNIVKHRLRILLAFTCIFVLIIAQLQCVINPVTAYAATATVNAEDTAIALSETGASPADIVDADITSGTIGLGIKITSSRPVYKISYVLTSGVSFKPGYVPPDTYFEGSAVTLPTMNDMNYPRGYTWGGWYYDQSYSGSYLSQIPSGSAGDKTLYFRPTAIGYTISYNLNGGSVSTANPTSYTVETNAFTLNNPTRANYKFTGWTGTGLSSATTTVTIEKGSTGNRSYTANWSALTATYKVEHYRQDISGDTYTLYETQSPTGNIGQPVTAVAKSYSGFSENTAHPSRVASGTVPSSGTLTLKLYYSRTSYTLAYNTNGGSSITSSSYKYEATWTKPTDPTKNGYTFDGWYKDSSLTQAVSFGTDKQPASNTTIYAKWTPLGYSIGYTLNGGSVSGNPTSYTVESNTFTLNNPTRNGYTFTGWSGTGLSSTTTTVTITKGSTGARTYTANWSLDSYGITYTLNGGSVSSNPTSYTVESNTFTLNNPTRNGYTFAGWTGTGLSSATTSVTIAKGSTGARTYTATWSLGGYSISYNLDGGSVSVANPTSYTVETNTFVLNNPTRAGYDFAGWTGTNLSSQTISVSIIKGSTGNRAYTATWSARTDTPYKVEHYQETASGTYAIVSADTETPKGTTNSTATAIAKTTYPGFTENTSHANRVASGTIRGDGSLTLRLYYSRISYSVTYNVNGGSTVSSASYKHGTTWTAPTDPTRTGYVFGGWYKDSALTQAFTIGTDTMPIGGISLYAKWNGADGTKYTVKYYKQNVSDDLFSEDTTLTQMPTGKTDTPVSADTPTYDGFTFDSTNANNVLSGSVQANGSLVLKVYYKRNSYKVAYSNTGAPQGAGTFPQEKSYKYEQSVSVEAGVLATGYIFTGWSPTPSLDITNNRFSMPAQNVEFRGSWIPDNLTYTVNYYLKDTTTKLQDSITVEHQTMGSKVTVSAPTIVGYTIDGQASVDITISATNTNNVVNFYYTINSYTVRYSSDGAPDGIGTLPEDRTYAYGTSVSVSAPINVSGYTFSGWVPTDPSITVTNNRFTMPAKDVTFRGTWSANTNLTYTVNYYLKDTTTKLKTTDTVTGQTMNTTISVKSADILGHKLTDGEASTKDITISANNANNVVNFYYSPKTYSVLLWMYEDITDNPITDVSGTQIKLSLTYNGQSVSMPKYADIGDTSKQYGYIVSGFKALGTDKTFKVNLSPESGETLLSANTLVDTLGDIKDGETYNFAAMWNAIYKVNVPTNEVSLTFNPFTQEISTDKDLVVQNASPLPVKVGAYSSISESDLPKAKTLFLNKSTASKYGLDDVQFSFAGKKFLINGGTDYNVVFDNILQGTTNGSDMAYITGPLSLQMAEDVREKVMLSVASAMKKTDAELTALGLTRQELGVSWGKIASITWLISSTTPGDYALDESGIGNKTYGPF